MDGFRFDYKLVINLKLDVMKKLMLCLFIFGITFQVMAQDPEVEELSEVKITAVNYKYLDEVGAEEASIPVKVLQKKVASFDVKDSPYYSDDYDYYDVSFFIPEGNVLAAYDADGNLLRTIERYKDVALPREVIEAVGEKYPKWAVSKDVYMVNYHQDKGVDKKYKIRLEKDGKRFWVKCDDKGNMQ